MISHHHQTPTRRPLRVSKTAENVIRLHRPIAPSILAGYFLLTSVVMRSDAASYVSSPAFLSMARRLSGLGTAEMIGMAQNERIESIGHGREASAPE